MSSASISGIFSQLDATSVAETLEKFQLITAHRGENLVDRHVRPCVQINNARATFLGRGQNGVGRNEPNTAEIGVKLIRRPVPPLAVARIGFVQELSGGAL